MAFKKLVESNQNSNPDKPWVKEWYDSLDSKGKKTANSTEYIVKKVSKVKSGKGFIVETDTFKTWVWGNSLMAKELVKELEVLVYGDLPLLLQLEPGSKDFFCLGVDPESKTKVTWYQQQSESEWEVKEVIPF